MRGSLRPVRQVLAVCCFVAALFRVAFAADIKLSDFKSADDKLTLKPGEKLVYSVRWMKMPVGQAVTQVEDVIDVNGQPAYHLRTYTKANRLIRLIYKVDDRFDSYVAVDGFHPLRFNKRLREGHRKKNERIEFDWSKKQAIYYKTKKGTETKRRTIEISDGVQDPLSGIYFLRGLPLRVGDEYHVTVTTERRCWVVDIKPLRKEAVVLAGVGRFTAIVIEPEIDFEGLFVHERKVTIWLDEETKIPLKMEADIPIGSINLVLCSIENTKAEKSKEPGRAPDPWTGRKPSEKKER